MKKLIFVSLALLLVCAVVPAMAGEKSNNLEPAAFQALSKLSTPGQVALNVMTDEQLAAVEGQRFQIFRNFAFIAQENKCEVCAFVSQTNYASVYQENEGD